VDAYQAAFMKMAADPEFKKTAEDTIEGYGAIPPAETVKLIKELAVTSDEALKTTDTMLQEQGLDIPKG
jgi:hypothetical protein